MNYNFDELISRRKTDCIKYDGIPEKYQDEKYLSMWIADMDFLTPPFIINAIKKRLDQKILGYTKPSNIYFETISKWLKHRFDFEVKTNEIHYMPGVVPGFFHAIKCFTKCNDKVMIQPPVYTPFHDVTLGCTCECIPAPLIISENGHMAMNFEKIEERISECKLFILCNPHNPNGIVWDVKDLKRLAHICKKNNVLVISDEIHADMTLPGYHYTPFAKTCEEARNNSITLMAPSKTFNMPGVIASYAIVFNEELRIKYYRYLDKNDVAMGSVFSYDCTCACYSEEGEDWLNQMLAYVQKNFDYIFNFLKENCPKIGGMCPEASFLLFLDNRKLGLTQEELVKFYYDEAHLYLNDGTMFGKEAKGFMRLNVAVPLSMIKKAMKQLKEAYDKRF